MKHYNFIFTIEADNEDEAIAEAEDMIRTIFENGESVADYCEIEEELD